MTEQLYVTAVLRAKAGKEEVLVAVLEELARHSRQEPGCLDYGYYRDIGDSAVIVSFESWRDAEAEAAHWKSDHLNKALADLRGVLECKPVVYKCTRLI